MPHSPLASLFASAALLLAPAVASAGMVAELQTELTMPVTSNAPALGSGFGGRLGYELDLGVASLTPEAAVMYYGAPGALMPSKLRVKPWAARSGARAPVSARVVRAVAARPARAAAGCRRGRRSSWVVMSPLHLRRNVAWRRVERPVTAPSVGRHHEPRSPEA